MKDEITNRKILLIDDEEAILGLLEVILKKESFKKIYKAGTGKDAVAKCREIHPDMIVLDIMLPDMDGYEVCKSIRNISMAPILFLSAKAEEIDKVISFTVGGDDYLTKPFSPRELIAHITAALRRLNYYEGMRYEKEQVCFGNFVLDFAKRELYENGQVVTMTSKEYLLLEYMVKNQNITLSKQQLLEGVWGDEYDGYDNTVMVHIHHLREKIEKNVSKPIYILTVKGRGYRFENTRKGSE